MLHTTLWLGVIAAWMNTLLFLFRVNGVFYDSLRRKICFGCTWLFSVVVLPTFPTQYTAAVSTPPNDLCAIQAVKRLAFLSLFPVAIFDWAVFIAISIRVIRLFAPHSHWRGLCKTFVTGADIGTIPRALLRTGQFYFL